jgi:GntR family transcriptional regulator, transcriptional repressor for pyruvate dehydrogenase complex
METIQRTRAVDTAANVLRRAILSGELPAGEALPAERKLSADLGVSRLTLRSAISHLEAEGLVRARQGSGVRVLDYRESGGVALLPHLMGTGDLTLLRPFLALRRAVAAEALAAACANVTESDLEGLEQMALELATANRAALAEGNLAFTAAVLAIADNLPIQLLFNTVSAVYRGRHDVVDAMLVHEDGVRASFMATVMLLRNGDPAFAREQVRMTLEVLDAATLAQMEAR